MTRGVKFHPVHILKMPWFSCLTPLLRQVSFLILGNMHASHQFLRKVISLKGPTTTQYQLSPSFQGSLKKLVFNQLNEYLVRNKLIHPGQSGFLKQHPTLTCLLKNIDDWYSGWDTGQMVGTVFIDLKRHSTLSTMTFSAKSYNTTVSRKDNCLGFSPISQTENSTA